MQFIHFFGILSNFKQFFAIYGIFVILSNFVQFFCNSCNFCNFKQFFAFFEIYAIFLKFMQFFAIYEFFFAILSNFRRFELLLKNVLREESTGRYVLHEYFMFFIAVFAEIVEGL